MKSRYTVAAKGQTAVGAYGLARRPGGRTASRLQSEITPRAAWGVIETRNDPRLIKLRMQHRRFVRFTAAVAVWNPVAERLFLVPRSASKT